MTPLALHLFMDACTTAATFEDYPNNNHMPVHKECMDMLEESGLLETHGDGCYYKPTAKGAAYLHFLCCLPLPVSNWTIPGPWTPSLSPTPSMDTLEGKKHD